MAVSLRSVADGRMYAGGSPNFNEQRGMTTMPFTSYGAGVAAPGAQGTSMGGYDPLARPAAQMGGAGPGITAQDRANIAAGRFDENPYGSSPGGIYSVGPGGSGITGGATNPTPAPMMATPSFGAQKPMMRPTNATASGGMFNPGMQQDWLGLAGATGGTPMLQARQGLANKYGWDDNTINSFENYGGQQGWQNAVHTAAPGGTQYGGTGIQSTAGPSLNQVASGTGVGAPAGGNGAAGGTMPGGVPSAAGPYNGALDINKFLDPNIDYRIQKGETALENSAAARGGLLSGATLKGINDYAQNEANNSFQQSVQNAMNDRTFGRGVYTNDRDYTTALGQFNQNFGENQRQFNQNFGERQNEFNTGVDQADRQFAYNAQTGDRNFNYQRLTDLMNAGLGSTTQDANTQRLLATLQAQLGQSAASAQGAGTIGANNSITNAISQALQYLMGTNTVNQATHP